MSKVAKKKVTKKKNTSKITVEAIEKKLNNKRKVIKKTSSYNRFNKDNKNIINYKENIKKSNTLKSEKEAVEEVKPKIYDQELEDVEIPIIKKTIEKTPKKVEINNEEPEEAKEEITHEKIKETIKAKLDKKLDEKIEEKINQKLSETGELNVPEFVNKKEEKKPSRKIAKKEDVFSKIMEWFGNLTSDLNSNIRKRKVTNIKKITPKKKKAKDSYIEEDKPKVYPKNKFLRALVIIHENLYILFDTIIILAFIILIIGMNRVQVIPSSTIKYIACIVGFLSLVAISLNKYLSGRIFTILITAGMVGGIYYLNYTYDFINNLNTKLYEYQEYYVVSLDNGRNKSIYNINNKKVGLLDDNSKNVKHVLNTKLDHVTYITYKNQDKLYEEFIESKTRAIIVKENQYKYIQNNNIKPDIRVKILYKFNVNTKK